MNLETPEIKSLVSRADEMLEIAREFKVDSPEMYEAAGKELIEIKSRRNAIEEQRKAMTRPLDESKRAVMDFFRVPLDRLDDAEAVLKRSLLAFKQEQDRKAEDERRRQAEEARRIQDEAKAKNPEAPPPVVVMTPTVKAPPKVAGIATRKVWMHRIVNPTEVPREYLVIDDQKLGALARATKGSVAVPGVEFYEEEVVAASRR